MLPVSCCCTQHTTEKRYSRDALSHIESGSSLTRVRRCCCLEGVMGWRMEEEEEERMGEEEGEEATEVEEEEGEGGEGKTNG